jgi:probable HAF family extracellular repeat protein
VAEPSEEELVEMLSIVDRGLRAMSSAGRRRRLRGALAGCAALTLLGLTLLGAAAAPAQPVGRRPTGWTFTDLGTLPGGRDTRAHAINDRGDVVGETTTGPVASPTGHAVLWRRNRVLDLGTLGGSTSRAVAINNRGEVVGSSIARNGRTHAFLWRNGRMTDLGTLPGGSAFVESRATAINDRGEVVGYNIITGSAYPTLTVRAFAWQQGQMTDLGALGVGSAAGLFVNNAGVVVGSSLPDGGNFVPSRIEHGTVTPLNGDFGHSSALLSAIDRRGQVIGHYIGGRDGSFLWSDGRLLDLGSLGSGATTASGMNDSGQIVGSSGTRAFLWQHGRITALPSPSGSYAGASDINNRGEIVGHSVSVVPAVPGDRGDAHAIRWTPRTP